MKKIPIPAIVSVVAVALVVVVLWMMLGRQIDPPEDGRVSRTIGERTLFIPLAYVRRRYWRNYGEVDAFAYFLKWPDLSSAYDAEGREIRDIPLKEKIKVLYLPAPIRPASFERRFEIRRLDPDIYTELWDGLRYYPPPKRMSENWMIKYHFRRFDDGSFVQMACTTGNNVPNPTCESEFNGISGLRVNYYFSEQFLPNWFFIHQHVVNLTESFVQGEADVGR